MLQTNKEEHVKDCIYEGKREDISNYVIRMASSEAIKYGDASTKVVHAFCKRQGGN